MPSDDSGYDYEGNLLYGGAGNDTITVGAGRAYGGDGNDRVSVCSGEGYGEAGNDTITMFACDDGDAFGFISGGGTVRGGPGADKLVFDTPVCGDLHVTYVGWEPGIDQITQPPGPQQHFRRAMGVFRERPRSGSRGVASAGAADGGYERS